MNIAVIGAGLSGLATIKELLEAGHNVVCFEKSGDIGGVFSDHGTYDSVRLTVSNYFMAYSDFMPYEDTVRFWTRAEYKAYLDRYADQFELRPHIRFNTHVEKLEQRGARWAIHLSRDGQSESPTFDRVAVCAGQFQFPSIPELPGLNGFEGTIIHSSEYTNTAETKALHGRRALCFGMGESAADIVAEIAEVASETVLSLRRYHMFATRCVGDLPIDAIQSRYWHTLPIATKSKEVRDVWRKQVQHSPNLATRLLGIHILCADDEPGSVVTKTERIFAAQADHGLDIDVGGVREFRGNTAIFNSGREQEFDALVFCTGFRFSLPFLPEELQFNDIRECFLQMIHPNIGESLAFIGFVRPQQGGIPLMAELQARYWALLCSGERTLPSDIAQRAEKDAERWRNEFFVTPHVFGLVNGLRFNDSIAELIGCKPPMPNPLRDRDGFLHYWFHHIWPCQYRLTGPGNREEARRMWMKSPALFDRAAQLNKIKHMLANRVWSILPTTPPEQRFRPI